LGVRIGPRWILGCDRLQLRLAEFESEKALKSGDGVGCIPHEELSAPDQHLTVLRAIARCRTADLGGHVDQCTGCGHQVVSYNSCRNRHCPKCQAQARQRWVAARERELLPVAYFHVVFTLPHELNALCRYNARILYDLLFSASAATMLEVAANPVMRWVAPAGTVTRSSLATANADKCADELLDWY